MKVLISALFLLAGSAYGVGTQHFIIDDSITSNLANASTSYIVSVTTSASGLGAWIDCRKAKKVIFQFKLAGDTDTATPCDTGTFYVESSIQRYDYLPATPQLWNTNVGGVQYQTATGYQYTVSDPVRSLRFRLSGTIRYTGSVYYQIIY